MKQHQQPCSECPFLKSSKPGALGGSYASTYIGQINGPFWLPCHELIDYSDRNWKTDYETSQCAGSAAFRANTGSEVNNPGIMRCPKSKAVFGTFAEFIAYHGKTTLDDAEQFLVLFPPSKLTEWETEREGAKVVDHKSVQSHSGGEV